MTHSIGDCKTSGSTSGRPAIAFMLRSFLPYNQHLCRRLCAEIPEIAWHFVFTSSAGVWDTDWPTDCTRYNLWEIDQEPANDFFKILPELKIRAAIVSGYHGTETKRLANWCRKQSVPFFVRADSNVLGDDRLPIPKRIMKQIVLRWHLRGARGAMPMGRLGRQYFARYGFDERRMYLVPHEPDYDQFQRCTEQRRGELMNRLKLVDERRRLLCCNRLVSVKRVDLVIRAFTSLASEFPNFDLVIAGSGDQESNLKNLVSAELNNRVIWTGQLQLNDIIPLYQSCDAFVLASSYEPWATVISEAAACGLPIVASDVVGAAREVFEDGVGGRLFRSGNLASLTDCLRDVLSHLPTYRTGVIAGLEDWRRRGDPVAGIRQALESVDAVAGQSVTRDEV